MHSELIAEINKLTNKNVPFGIVTSPDGRVVTIQYEKEWKEGGTKAVEKTIGKGKNAITTIEYEEDYKTVKLTADEVKKLDAYIAEKTKAK